MPKLDMPLNVYWCLTLYLNWEELKLKQDARKHAYRLLLIQFSNFLPILAEAYSIFLPSQGMGRSRPIY